MKKKIRYLTQTLTAFAVGASLVMPASAEDTALIKIGGGYTSQNEVTSVTASVDGGVKAAAYSITLNFDPALLEFVDAASLLDDGMFCFKAVDEDSVKLIWSNDKDTDIDGDIFKASFKTRGESCGHTAEITVGEDTVIGSEKMTEIPFDAQSGALEISEDYKWGDANCDGSTDIADVVAIDKYCTDMYFELPEQGVLNADVNNDTYLNELDSAAVIKFAQKNAKEVSKNEN